jgi:undecaprenyl-diphosphatase
VALLPGISRSGSTIAGGLVNGLSREAAARFSFLIAIPAIGGAAIVEGVPILMSLFHGTPTEHSIDWSQAALPLLAGAATSFVVGLVSLNWLLRVIVRRGLNWFALYCLCAALATFAWQLAVRVAG